MVKWKNIIIKTYRHFQFLLTNIAKFNYRKVCDIYFTFSDFFFIYDIYK